VASNPEAGPKLKARRKAYDSLLFLVAWRIWFQRSDRVFRDSGVCPDALAELIWQLCALWVRAGLIVWSQLVGD
jgi:hypothetical protein